MSKIIRLDRHTADLIAAGEVVERPASVVKELAENAVDAGATVITVEIKAGGTPYIRVTDNGSGMSPEDAGQAFLRHATSKLRDARGLEAIVTLGFRGEALAAISAVSRIGLLTKTSGAAEGTAVNVEAGTVTRQSPAGCPEGTTLVVRDLFYNTPARLKFLKSDRAEAAGVSAAVTACALSHPEVSVRYIRDGREECHTPGDSRAESAIYSLFGREFASGLVPVHADDGAVRVTGFISQPGAARGNRSYQYFIVNGRPVKSRTLQTALERAYRNSLFTGRYPSCVLYIGLRHSSVDVNVHPAKTEVKFQDEKAVFDGVYYAALSALERPAAPPEITLSPGTVKAMEPKAPSPAPRAETPKVYIMPEPAPARPRGGGDGIPTYPERRRDSEVRDAVRSLYNAGAGRGCAAAPAREEAETPELPNMPPPAPYRIIGEAMGTYIIAECGGSLWLIDKHAAHERLHFDRLRAEGIRALPQVLLTPLVLRPGARDMATLLENAGMLRELGFLVESFGEGAVAVREAPQDIDLAELAGTLGELCEDLRHGGDGDMDARRDAVLRTVACKAAIKAGRATDVRETQALAGRVLSGELRYCPHGRPVAVELTKAALDKSFKRI